MTNRDEKQISTLRTYIDAKNAYLIELIFYVIQKVMPENQTELYMKKSNIFSTIHLFLDRIFVSQNRNVIRILILWTLLLFFWHRYLLCHLFPYWNRNIEITNLISWYWDENWILSSRCRCWMLNIEKILNVDSECWFSMLNTRFWIIDVKYRYCHWVMTCLHHFVM